MAISKVVYKSSASEQGVTWMDATPATAAASDVISPKTAMLADGVVTQGTGSSGGADCPTFTITVDSGWTSVTSVTCDKTYSECQDYASDGIYYAIFEVNDGSSTQNNGASLADTPSGKLVYGAGASEVAWLIVEFSSNGTITATLDPITWRDSTDMVVSGATVTAPSGYYEQSASASVSSGTEGTPTATKGTVSSHSVSVTPSVTNSAGYITGSTKTGTAVSVSASELVSGTLTVNSSGTKDVTNYASASIPDGTAGTPSATKGTVSNHSVSVTPSVTNQTGWITGSTKTGVAVTVTASELVSGSETKTANGTYDVTNLASLVVNVAASGASIDTKTVTASNYPTSISFSSMKGTPKAFFLRSTSQISSSGSTSYYYVIDLAYDGNANNYCDGNCFRIGSTRRVDPITTAVSGGVVSGYTWSYSGSTLTITSSAASRSASPGAFNNGYKLVYIY